MHVLVHGIFRPWNTRSPFSPLSCSHLPARRTLASHPSRARASALWAGRGLMCIQCFRSHRWPPISALLDNLKHHADGPRHRTRIELSACGTKEVIVATQSWMKQFDPAKAEHALHLVRRPAQRTRQRTNPRPLAYLLADRNSKHAAFQHAH